MSLGRTTLACDQSPEADVVGYRIYCGQSAGVLQFLQEFPVASLSNPSAPSMLCTSFPFYGLLYFGSTAYDTSNNESAMSNIISTALAPVLHPMTWP